MAHCFPAAGKWRRESKNPQRKRGKPVDFSSNPGTRLAWKSVEAILKGAVYPRERPRNLAREKSSRFEKYFTFPPMDFSRILHRIPTRNGLLVEPRDS